MATNPTIQFKRKTTSGIPASLSIGEPAVNTADNQLFIGVNSSGVKWIGAEIENSSTNGTTWTSDIKLATKKAIGDYFAPLSGPTFTGDVYLDNNKAIRLYEADANGNNYIAITTSSAITNNITYILPEAPGADGYVLSSTTGGTLSWISAGTASSVSVTETGGSASYNLVFTNANSTTSASLYIDSSDNITFNPSTNDLTTSGDIAVNGGDITSTATTFNLLNSTVTSLNIGGDATSVSIAGTSAAGQTVSIASGAPSSGTRTLNLGTDGDVGSTTNVNIGSGVGGTVTINSGTLSAGAMTTTQNVFNTIATTVNAFGAATAITMGDSTTATTTIRGGTLVGNTTTQNVFNATATTVAAFGAATTIAMGDTTTCSTNIRGGTLQGNATTQNVFNTTATTVNAFGAATSVTIGSTSSGTAHIRNSNLRLGNTTNTITTNTAAGSNHLTLAPYGDVILAPTSTTAPLNSGTFPTVTVNPGVQATVDFAGGDIYLGTKSNDDLSPVVTPVNIIWEGATDDNYETTLTVADPTDDRTITLPNATGTVALVAGSDTQVMFNDGGSALGGDSGLTYNKTTDTLTITGDLAVNGGDITSSATTFNLLNSTVTSLNLGGASTAITMGDSTTSTTTIRGGTLVGNTTTQNVFNTTATTVNAFGAATTVTIGSSTATINLGGGTTGASVVIKGDLQVDGTTTTVNSTTVTIDDLNIVLADGVSAAASADGGGISLGTTGITWTYLHSATSWSSTQNINVATGKTYKINSVDVLTATTLGSTVTGSSLTSVGTIGTGVWNGTTIGVGYGGTGLTTYTTGQILYASASSTLAGLTASSTAGAVVASTGAGNAPEYKTISVTNGSVTSGSGTLTLAIQDAAANGSTKGLAAFNSTQFDDASGVITLDTIDGGTYA